MFKRKYKATLLHDGLFTTDAQYFERHKLQVAMINSPEAKKYLLRLGDCRPSRRCHLWACLSCMQALKKDSREEVQAMFAGLPLDKVAWVTCLLKPRDAIYQPPDCPEADMQELRRVFADLRKANPDLEITVWGRYELVFARRDSTQFLKSHARLCDGSEVLVPHIHALVLFKKKGVALSQAAVRWRMRRYFLGNRQLKVGPLKSQDTYQAALRGAVGYIVKGHTSTFRGSGLRDYLKFQTETRTDAWFLKIPTPPAARRSVTPTASAVTIRQPGPT